MESANIFLRVTIGFMLILAFFGSVACKQSKSSVQIDKVPFQKGICYAHIHRFGFGYGSEKSVETMGKLKALGVEWLSLTPFGYQRTVSSPKIYYALDRTLSADNLVKEIRNAHSLGLKVILKPHIWSSEFWYGNKWHGDIAMGNEEHWKTWFENYSGMMLHFAKISASENVEALSIGCELEGTIKRTGQWNQLIKEIKEIYPGLITYSASQGEVDKVPFWNEMDFIGVNAYFPVAAKPGASVEDMVKGWQKHLLKLETLSKNFGKPIVFTEVGYRSVKGTAIEPWRWQNSGDEVDYEEQVKAYKALFEATRNRPWFKGLYMWKAFTALKIEDEDTDFGYSPMGKPAEKVMGQYFTSEDWP